MNIPEPTSYDAEVQADIPEPEEKDDTIKIRRLERIKLHPKVPPEPSAYGKGRTYSRPWILRDGREPPEKQSQMKAQYTKPKKLPPTTGIRKRMLTDFFWEEMLEEVIEELATAQPVSEYCTEYETHFVKENFQPRNLEVPLDKHTHLKYPLVGTGSSPITYYSQVIKKTGATPILHLPAVPNGDLHTDLAALHAVEYEAVVLHRNIPYFKETQRFTVSLPNAWNFAFHMPTFLKVYNLLMCRGLYLVIIYKCKLAS